MEGAPSRENCSMPGSPSTAEPRKVRCPKCNVILSEPPPGTPIYQCASCLTLLQAKHAISSGGVVKENSAASNKQLRSATAEISPERDGELLVGFERQAENGLEQESLASAVAAGLSWEKGSNEVFVTDSSKRKGVTSDEDFEDDACSLGEDQLLCISRDNRPGVTCKSVPNNDGIIDDKQFYLFSRRTCYFDTNGECSERSKQTVACKLDQVSRFGLESDLDEASCISQAESSVSLSSKLGMENRNRVDPVMSRSSDILEGNNETSKLAGSVTEIRKEREQEKFKTNLEQEITGTGVLVDGVDNTIQGGPTSFVIEPSCCDSKEYVKQASALEDRDDGIGGGLAIACDRRVGKTEALAGGTAVKDYLSDGHCVQGDDLGICHYLTSLDGVQATSAPDRLVKLPGSGGVENFVPESLEGSSEFRSCLIASSAVHFSEGDGSHYTHAKSDMLNETAVHCNLSPNSSKLSSHYRDQFKALPERNGVHSACWNYSYDFTSAACNAVDHCWEESSPALRNLSSRNVSEDRYSFEFKLREVDTESKDDIYDPPLHLGDDRFNKVLSSTDDDPMETGSRPLHPVQSDPSEGEIVSLYLQSDDIPKAKFLERKLISFPHSNSAFTPKRRYLNESLYLMGDNTSHLVEDKGCDAGVSCAISMAECHLMTETDLAFSGHRQIRDLCHGDRDVQGNQGTHIYEEKHGNATKNISSCQRIAGQCDPYMSMATRNTKGFGKNRRGVFGYEHVCNQSTPCVTHQGISIAYESGRPRQVAKTDFTYGQHDSGYSHLSNKVQEKFPEVQLPYQGFTSHACSVHAPHVIPSQNSSCDHSVTNCSHHILHHVCPFCIHQSHIQHHKLLHGRLQNDCALCISQPTCMACTEQSLLHLQPSYALYESSSLSHDIKQQGLPHHLQSPPFHNSYSLYEHGFARHDGSKHGGLINHLQSSPLYHSHSSHESGSTRCNSNQHRAHGQLNLDGQLSRKKKQHPPLPLKGAAPFVMCQHCDQLLQVPSRLPLNNENLQKLRCSGCMKVSKFSVYQVNSINHTPKMSSSFSEKCLMIRSQADSHLSQGAAMRKFDLDTGTFLPSEFGVPVMSDKQKSSVNHAYVSHKDMNFAHERDSNNWNGDCRFPTFSTYGQQECRSPSTNIVTNAITAASLDSTCFSRPSSCFQDSSMSKSTSPSTSAEYDISGSSTSSLHTISKHQNVNSKKKLSPPSSSEAGSNQVTCADVLMMRYQSPDGPTKHRVVGGLGTGLLSDSSFQRQDAMMSHSDAGPEFQRSSHNAEGDVPHELPVAVPTLPLHKHLGYRSPAELIEGYPANATSSKSLDGHHQQLEVSNISGIKLISSSIEQMAYSPKPGSLLFENSYKSIDSGQRFQPLNSPKGDSSKFVPWNSGHHAWDFSADYEKGMNRESFHDASRGQRSFINFLMKSLKELPKGGQGNGNSHRRVIVNGHSLSADDVKNAEEKAGKIHPGSYWYDYHAGFWGVTGGPCLGIIPPFIEELNYPMSRDCADGKTGVLANGRELHQKDLELLAHRGLPSIRGRSYMIEINGRVVDVDSGQLLSLGKLAPTVVKKGHGDGMFHPAAI